jgi:hypothetical protein
MLTVYWSPVYTINTRLSSFESLHPFVNLTHQVVIRSCHSANFPFACHFLITLVRLQITVLLCCILSEDSEKKLCENEGNILLFITATFFSASTITFVVNSSPLHSDFPSFVCVCVCICVYYTHRVERICTCVAKFRIK